MKSPGKSIRWQRWLRGLGLGAAGVLGFVVAASLGSESLLGGSAANVVAPTERASTTPSRGKGNLWGVSIQGNSSPGGTAMDPTHAERLNSAVIHNPFGTLNLKAGMATLGEPAQAASAPASTPKPIPKQAEVAPPPPPPPPPPTAPPLPFVAVGSITGAHIGDGQQTAFIRQQEQLLLVRAGDAIGNTYRVESITARKIEFTYLPLMQRQTLALAP